MDIGCICHLANLCCVAGVKEIPFPIDDLIVDIFYHFHHSAKRKEQYTEFLEFCDVEPTKILKHVTTRWLSLQKTVTRTLHHWNSLSSYFQSHNDVEKEGKIKKISQLLNNPEVKMYFLFLEFILGPLNEFNTTFQAGTSKIGVVHDHMVRLLRKFLAKFVKASVISQHIVTAVPFDDKASQIEDSKLAIGLTTRTFIHDHEDSISSSLKDKFFRKVRCFYEAVTRKMIKKFPFNDSTLKDMAVLNPENKGKLSSDCVLNLALRFPNVVLENERDRLMEEFQDYQLTPPEELPTNSDVEDTENKIDHFWGDLAKVKEPFENTLRFGLLCRLMKACLVLSVSNADSERTFSMLKKIQTEGRSELGHDTICALLCTKLNQHDSCFQYVPDSSVLKQAKSATSTYLQEKKNL